MAPARLETIYVDRTDTAQRVLDLREADTDANVLLIEPVDVTTGLDASAGAAMERSTGAKLALVPYRSAIS